MSRSAGVSDQQLAELSRFESSAAFSPLEKLVLRYATAMTRTPVDVADDFFAALRDHFGLTRATFVFGTLAGKDVEAMADAIAPVADAVFVSGWRSARAADAREIATPFRGTDATVTVMTDLAQAYEAAVAHAGERGTVVAFGAIAFVAQLREYLLGIESDRIMLASKS